MIYHHGRDGESLNRLLFFCLLLAFYYPVYRYPLQIGDSQTSPTYSDTPAFLQLGKYVLLAFGLTRFVLQSRSLSVSVQSSWLGVGLPAILLIAVLSSLLVADRSLTRMAMGLEPAIFLIVPLAVIAFGYGPVDIKRVNRRVFIFFMLSMVVSLVQVLLYLYTGRLPALAYEGSLSIRFGSLWDDPNSFPLMLSVFVPLVLCRFPHFFVAFLMVVICVFILVSAQALTAAGSLAVAALVTCFVRMRDNSSSIKDVMLLVYCLLAASIAVAIIAQIFPLRSGFMEAWYLEKQGSIDAHHLKARAILEIGPLSYLGLSPADLYGESGWLNMVTNKGIPYSAIYVGYIFTGIYRSCVLAIRGNKVGKGLFYGCFSFQVAYAVGLSNIPYDMIFPVNLIQALLWSVAYIEYQRLRLDWRRAHAGRAESQRPRAIGVEYARKLRKLRS